MREPIGLHHQNNSNHRKGESQKTQLVAIVGSAKASHQTVKHRQKFRRTNASPRSTASQSLRGRISAVTASSLISRPPSGK